MRVAPLIIQITLLALWLGAAVFFAAAVAPALFAVLPSRSLAGAVVGRLLPAILYSGMLIGVAAGLVTMLADDFPRSRGRDAAEVVMIAACAVAQFIVGPRIERVRASITGAIENLPVDDARRLAFGRLHGISVAWLGLAMLAAAWALVTSARQLSNPH